MPNLNACLVTNEKNLFNKKTNEQKKKKPRVDPCLKPWSLNLVIKLSQQINL